ncbi:hypothetical protein [Paenibacillus contaminans]|uniref:Uncharacterized protein n=1 Tax=Paenibacillus contaminans TaxID=450362 RepID=A0A329MG19_9BACL|nr:hypothetical protein [Paenibacillus contaminans]RAV18859.1 hypothetical protein DQG23_24330 [Paenibacillus contaminans]
MAVFKIEVELDWISEEGDLDSIIKAEVINGLQAKFTERIEKSTHSMLNKKLEEVAGKVTDDFLKKIMSDTVSTMTIPHKSSEWGSEVQMLTLSEFVGMRYDRYLKEKVFDKDGNTPRYSSDAKMSIHEFFINKFLEKELIGKMTALIKNARQEAEETVIKTLESNLKAQLSADLINRLNIPSLLKSLQEKAATLEAGSSE